MLTYNLYQLVLNAWCVVGFVNELAVHGMPVWGNAFEPSTGSYRLSLLIWIHYNNKYVELLDTVFMMLRKKNKQISFLHVYHHVLLIWSWFFVCKWCCGGDAYFGALCNSFVHVVMYGYYFMSALGVSCPWKRYITQMQMVQFVVCAAHAVFCLVRGHVGVGLPLLQLWVMVNMLVLFGNFYRQSYRARKSKAAATTATAAAAMAAAAAGTDLVSNGTMMATAAHAD